MFKIVLLAALAFQASLAHHHEQEYHHDTQELLEHVRSVSHDAVNAIQNVHTKDHQIVHVFYHEAHELAHNVHEIAYHLEQIVQHNHNGQGQQVLQGVVNKLYDIGHAIQQAMHNTPTVLQSLLKVQIESLVTEAGKLGTVAQQIQSSEDVNNELLVVLDDLLVAIQQFHVRSSLQYQNQQSVQNQIQIIANQVSNTIEHVNVNDAEAVEHLVHISHHLAHHLGDIIRKLERESHHHHGEIRDVLRQVINKLSEIRATLEQAERADCTVQELQHELNNLVHAIAVQVQRLVHLAHSDKLNEQEAINLRNVIYSVLGHTLAAERQLQRNVEHLIGQGQLEHFTQQGQHFGEHGQQYEKAEHFGEHGVEHFGQHGQQYENVGRFGQYGQQYKNGEHFVDHEHQREQFGEHSEKH